MRLGVGWRDVGVVEGGITSAHDLQDTLEEKKCKEKMRRDGRRKKKGMKRIALLFQGCCTCATQMSQKKFINHSDLIKKKKRRKKTTTTNKQTKNKQTKKRKEKLQAGRKKMLLNHSSLYLNWLTSCLMQPWIDRFPHPWLWRNNCTEQQYGRVFENVVDKRIKKNMSGCIKKKYNLAKMVIPFSTTF